MTAIELIARYIQLMKTILIYIAAIAIGIIMIPVALILALRGELPLHHK